MGAGSSKVGDAIRCHSCHKVLGQDEGNRVVVKDGKGEVRVYQASAIGFTCPRCGGRQDRGGLDKVLKL